MKSGILDGFQDFSCSNAGTLNGGPLGREINAGISKTGQRPEGTLGTAGTTGTTHPRDPET